MLPILLSTSEMIVSAKSRWKEFEICLLNKNEECHLDEDGDPITFIVKESNSLHSTVFLTKSYEQGETKILSS